jgi:polysaccharide biosynthesis protein PslH
MPLRILFLKEAFGWPRASGHDVHTFHLMQALGHLGHTTALATIEPSPTEAIANGGQAVNYCYKTQSPPTPPADMHPLTLTRWQEKFRNYWGINIDAIRWVGACSADFRADAVAVSGLRVLPYLGALPAGTKAVWYAADEWVLHHLSQVKLFRPGTWREIRQAIDKGLYERAYRKRLDRVWVVSDSDAQAFRRFAKIDKVDVLPNGVDADHYAPGNEPVTSNSCTFWGRLDFGPNIQALEWFLNTIWPRVRSVVPAATFDVFGFQPGPDVVAMTQAAGVSLSANVPDLRGEIRRRAVVVLPFVSGGGIKNKLLEAAAMGMPVLATPRVTAELNGTPPIATAATPLERCATPPAIGPRGSGMGDRASHLASRGTCRGTGSGIRTIFMK